MGKIIELFSSSYEFLLRNCNKIYCFIKACWNLFSKSHQQAEPSIFLCRIESTWELKSALSCFAFWENMMGLSNHHLPHVFCCSLCALSCSICVCSEFLQSPFFFIVIIEMFVFRTMNRHVHTCVYTGKEIALSQRCQVCIFSIITVMCKYLVTNWLQFWLFLYF